MAGYYNPITTPGQQSASKYPRVGPNYQKWGEQPGLTYDPQTDRYYTPEKWNVISAQRKQEQTAADAINHPKKPAGLAQQVGPIAAVAGTGIVANEVGKRVIASYWPTAAESLDAAKLDAISKAGAGEVAAQTGGQAAAGGNGVVAQLPAGSGNIGGNGTLNSSLATEGTAATRPLSPNEIAQPDGNVIDSNTGATTGQWVQGAAGAIQVIAGINQFQNGDKAGGALNVGAGGAQIGAAVYGPASTAAGVSQVLGPIAGVYGGYQTAKMIGSAPAGGKRNFGGALGGAAAGAGIGAAFGGVGALPGAVIGGTIGALGSYFGSSKDKYQMMRDMARKTWLEHGIIDKDYKGTLADGTKYDFGKDGKGLGKVDFKDETVGRIASLANVIAAGEGATGKAGEAVANLYLRAALSNAGGDYNKALANIKHFAAQRGFTSANVQEQLEKLHKDGAITEDQYKVWSADKNVVFGPGAKNQPGAQPQPQPQQQQQQPAVQQASNGQGQQGVADTGLQQANNGTGQQGSTSQTAIEQPATNNRSMNTYGLNIGGNQFTNQDMQQAANNLQPNRGPINPLTGQPILPNLSVGGLMSIGQAEQPQGMVNYGAKVTAQPRVNGQPQQGQQQPAQQPAAPGQVAIGANGVAVPVPAANDGGPQGLPGLFHPNFGGKTSQQVQADLKAQQDALKAQQDELKRQDQIKKQQEAEAKRQEMIIGQQQAMNQNSKGLGLMSIGGK